MLGKHVIFLERIRIEQGLNTVTGSHFAHSLLLFDGFFTTAHPDFLTSFLKFLNLLLNCHFV